MQPTLTQVPPMAWPSTSATRAPRCAADYQSKVSGPLLDRIDLHVEVDPVSAADLALPPPAEGSLPDGVRLANSQNRIGPHLDVRAAGGFVGR